MNGKSGSTVVLTGGGSGGHLASIEALGRAFMNRGVSVVFIGSTTGQERRWLTRVSGLAAEYFLPVRGVVDRGPWGRLASLALIARSTVTAAMLLRKHQARVVVSVGGYAAGPASLAAVIRGRFLVIHEHNVVMSLLHKVVRPWASVVFSSYETASPEGDYPVRQCFFDSARPRGPVRRVIFIGGSQGARFINDLALAAAPELLAAGIGVIHQTGITDFQRVQTQYATRGLTVDVFGFEADLSGPMSRADLAVTRVGAGTIWELAANGLPAVFIPYPFAARDHQYYNGRFFADQGLGLVVRQDQASVGTVLAAAQKDWEVVSRRLMTMVKPGGAERMVEHIMDLAGLKWSQ